MHAAANGGKTPANDMRAITSTYPSFKKPWLAHISSIVRKIVQHGRSEALLFTFVRENRISVRPIYRLSRQRYRKRRVHSKDEYSDLAFVRLGMRRFPLQNSSHGRLHCRIHSQYPQSLPRRPPSSSYLGSGLRKTDAGRNHFGWKRTNALRRERRSKALLVWYRPSWQLSPGSRTIP